MFRDKDSFKNAYIQKLELLRGTSLEEATDADKYIALGVLIREYLTRGWIATNELYKNAGVKQVYYLSMEFLLGRLAGNNLINLGIRELCAEGLQELGIDLDRLEEQEPDAGLGNGGLGRLAACFLDSMASLNLPGHGCGIRYKYGLFEQRIIDGYQVELPEYWLREGNVWEIRKSDKALEVKFGGDIRPEWQNGRLVFHHEGYQVVMAVPYDIPVCGYGSPLVNTLRLWSAEVDPQCHDYFTSAHNGQKKALDNKYESESISQFLYPDDTYHEGRVLRLKQEYFLVSASLQGIIRRFKKHNDSLKNLPQKIAIHINDTHPALAIPELMRLLMDEEGLGWEEAFHITGQVISYTNHTTLSEALETWPEDVFKTLLPRIFMIVEEMNESFCRGLWEKYPGQWGKIGKMAIIADGQVKMSHLAVAGSHSVNGVAKIHTKILKKREMKDFYQAFPQKFNNKTNGITHRRWLLKANPELAELISSAIGRGWIKDPIQLKQLQGYARDRAFQEEAQKAKNQRKQFLAQYIKEKNGVAVDINSIFDVQVKRIHAYKRQILNVLHIMELYNRLREDPSLDIHPRTFIFAGKAAPGYLLAKDTIKLINTVAAAVNSDKHLQDKIKMVFLENYRVSLAEMVIPAADISKQISTATKEASGTGNMKFMMNGAVTLGTLDGANIEILEEVGSDNMFIFGLSPSEVLSYYRSGGYRSVDIYNEEHRIRKLMDQLKQGFPSSQNKEFKEIYDLLLTENDEYFVLKDYFSYAEACDSVDRHYRDRGKWLEMSITNIACSGKFSSDRTVSEYAEEIWGIEPVKEIAAQQHSS